MDKQKKVVLASMILAAVLVLILAAVAIYKYIAPSNEKKDLNTIFELGESEVALILDDERQESKGLTVDKEIYVPADLAAKAMDQRIYVDKQEGILSYVTSKGVIQAKTDAASYQIMKETKKTEKPILIRKGKTFYVSLTFIGEHTSCYYKAYSSPSRLIIMSDRTKSYTFSVLTSDTRLRTGPGKKYPYLTEMPEGSRVIIETETKQENDYMAVTTDDGVTGYIPVDRVGNKEEAAWKFEKTPESFGQKGLGKTVCLGWHQMTTNISSMPTSLVSATSMNVLSPTWFALSDNKGNYTSLANTDYVNQAHTRGLQVWGLINDFAVADKKVKLSKVLGATSTRTKLINSLVGSAIQYDLDGINVDFENVTKDTATAYLEFLRELTVKCHVNDLIVSVDNYAPANYNAYYDLAEQGRVVDYVILMAYDEHWRGGGESGSVSSLGFVKKGVEDMLAKVPKERMVTALPFFTRLWKEGKSKKATSPSAYGMSSAESLLRSHDTSPEWDDKTGQYYAQYKSDGFTYKIWLEEETSLKKKLEVVKKKEAAGVAFWKLGFERAATWNMIGGELK